MHPEMSSYTKIVLRVRAVNGFHEFLSLHHDINAGLCRKGLSHEQFPLTPALLLDPHILTSEGFAGFEKTLFHNGVMDRQAVSFKRAWLMSLGDVSSIMAW